MMAHRSFRLAAVLLALAAGPAFAQPSKAVNNLAEVPGQGVVVGGHLIPGGRLAPPDQLDFCSVCKCCKSEKLSYEGFIKKYQPDAASTRALKRWDGDAEIRHIDLSPAKR